WRQFGQSRPATTRTGHARETGTPNPQAARAEHTGDDGRSRRGAARLVARSSLSGCSFPRRPVRKVSGEGPPRFGVPVAAPRGANGAGRAAGRGRRRRRVVVLDSGGAAARAARTQAPSAH